MLLKMQRIRDLEIILIILDARIYKLIQYLLLEKGMCLGELFLFRLLVMLLFKGCNIVLCGIAVPLKMFGFIKDNKHG